MLKSKTVTLILLIYVFLVVLFQISFLHSNDETHLGNSNGNNPAATQEVTSFRRSRFSRKRMQQIILAEDQAEMAVLKGQDSDSAQTNLFSEAKNLPGGSSSSSPPTLASSSDRPKPPSIPVLQNSVASAPTQPPAPTVSPHLLDLTPDPKFRPGKDDKQPVSKIVCKKGSANCAIKNLYYWNKRFHVFTPGAGKDKIVHLNTGIGFGTPSVAIYVHNEPPPAHFASARRIAEVSSIYSIMWENFMRTIYAGSGAWYTLMEHGLFSTKHRIFLHEPQRLKDFAFLLEGVTDYGYQFLEDVENVVFNSAVIGISRQFRIKEIELEYVPDDDLRKRAFIEFSTAVRNGLMRKSSIPFDENELMERLSDPNRDQVVTIIKRNGTRTISNSDQLKREISKVKGVVAKEYYFETLSFPEQVKVVFESDILIGMHGAAMAHVFFMRPGATLLELFPYAFRKIVYQNLAPLVNALYFGWQNQQWENTVFNWNYVETHKLTNWTKEEILTKPLDWYNMDSKNYWRQQDTTMDIPNFMDAFRVILNKEQTEYLLYLPNKESPALATIQFAMACAVGKQLKRRVVISPVGWLRQVEEKDEDGVKQTREELYWTALEEHFNQAELLPCDFITISNFNSLYLNLKLPQVYARSKDVTDFKDQFQSALHVEPLKFDLVAAPLIKGGMLSTRAFSNADQFLTIADLDVTLLGVTLPELAKPATLPGFLETIGTATTVPHLYAPYVQDAAAKLGSASLGVHLWLASSKSPTLDQVKASVSTLLTKTSAKKVFVSTPLNPTDPQLADFVSFLESKGVTPLLRADLLDVLSPRVLDLFEIEQLERQFLLSSRFFLGVPESSFSQLVNYARVHNGKSSSWIQ